MAVGYGGPYSKSVAADILRSGPGRLLLKFFKKYDPKSRKIGHALLNVKKIISIASRLFGNFCILKEKIP